MTVLDLERSECKPQLNGCTSHKLAAEDECDCGLAGESSSYSGSGEFGGRVALRIGGKLA